MDAARDIRGKNLVDVVTPIVAATQMIAKSQAAMQRINPMSVHAPAYMSLTKVVAQLNELSREVGKLPW